MLDAATLASIAKVRLDDAKALFLADRYDGAVYLCGYAVEVALKARIVQLLKWEKFPDSKEYSNFKTHDLDVLVHLSGQELRIKTEFLSEWSIVKQWTPELRYNSPGYATPDQANDIITSTEKLISELI
jgi:HEPN domain-containing protein